MKLHPFNDCVKQAKSIMDKGHLIYQQFNCAKCGTKQTMDVPNVFYKTGHCEECGHITNMEKDGCNYMAHFKL
jgi:transcription elongation factor Elf1